MFASKINRSDPAPDPELALEQAEQLFAAHEWPAARRRYEALLMEHAGFTAGRVRYAYRLRQMGHAVEALRLLETIRPDRRSKTARVLIRELSRAVATLTALAPDRLERGDNTGLIALRCLVESFAGRRSRIPPSRQLGATALITGSLGPGGAEFQLASTTQMMAAASKTLRRGERRRVRGPLHVVVKSLSGPGPGDFHLQKVQEANARVWEIEKMTPILAAGLAGEPEPAAALLSLLAPNVAYGFRLVDWFRRQRIEVAYIWQDGAALFAVLAALLAGVPRIVINLRGLPPILRKRRYVPEYDELYRALLKVPGVVFVSNSRRAAQAYADWLGCSSNRFHIIRNGIDSVPSRPAPLDLHKWEQFELRTAGADTTIGGVFRMELDKRPNEWLRFARYYLDRHPGARFILVGKGQLLEQAQSLAKDLKLSRRLMFVRQTRAVGFWLEKFDAFVLLSRFEGTPNVLIEAQICGVGVVSTPVGSAQDTFIEGVTGFATESAEALNVADITDKVDRIVSLSRNGSLLSQVARRNAAARYSTESMFNHTIRVLTGVEDQRPAEQATTGR